jgi:uncharacterized membrane protein
MDVASTSPDLFFSRIASHLCAPVFVFLTGLGAFLSVPNIMIGLRFPAFCSSAGCFWSYWNSRW